MRILSIIILLFLSSCSDRIIVVPEPTELFKVNNCRAMFRLDNENGKAKRGFEIVFERNSKGYTIAGLHPVTGKEFLVERGPNGVLQEEYSGVLPKLQYQNIIDKFFRLVGQDAGGGEWVVTKKGDARKFSKTQPTTSYNFLIPNSCYR